jgi:hypothetical protein
MILQGTTSSPGNPGITAFSHVYVFCTAMVALALLVTLFWLRFAVSPAPAPARTETAAVAGD